MRRYYPARKCSTKSICGRCLDKYFRFYFFFHREIVTVVIILVTSAKFSFMISLRSNFSFGRPKGFE